MKRHRIREFIIETLTWISDILESWANSLQYVAENMELDLDHEFEYWRPWFGRWQKKSIILALGLFLFSTPAHADSLSVAVVDAQGNTDTQSVNVDGEFTRKSDDGSMTQELKAGLLYGETDGKRSSEYWYGNLKDLHYLAPDIVRPYWFSLTGVESDEFAGYDLRLSFHLGLGLNYTSPGTARHEFKIEAGPGIIAEEREVVVYTETYTVWDVYLSARAWQEWTWHITDTLDFSEQIEYLYDYDDPDNYRVNAEAGLTGKINSWLSFKLGPKARYVNKPVTGKKRTDIISSATVIFSFR